MEDKVYETETVWNADYILNSLWQTLNIVFIVVIIYYIIKLYIKISKYLDRNS